MRGGLADRGVQRGDGQRLPELQRQTGILAVLLEQFGNCHVLRQAKVHGAQGEHEVCSLDPFAPAQTFCIEQREQQMQRGRQTGGAQFKILMQVQLQRQAQEIAFDIAADPFDHPQRLAVTAE